MFSSLKNSLLAFALIFSSIFHFSFAQCNSKNIAKVVKNNLHTPYLYGASELTKITFDNKEKKKKIEFTALPDVKYRIIFCSSNFEEMVKVNIYDTDNKNIAENKVFDNSQGVDNNYWVFDPPKAGNYHIVYDIPTSVDGVIKTGCIVLIIGYVDEELESAAASTDTSQQ